MAQNKRRRLQSCVALDPHLAELNKRLMDREFYAEYTPQSNSKETGVVMKRESGIATAQCCGDAYLNIAEPATRGWRGMRFAQR